MKNWRTVVGALCIVLAMLLGAFAGFAYARPGVVGASPNAGTRAEDRRLTSVFDESQKLLDESAAGEVALSESNEPVSILGSESAKVVSADGLTVDPVSQADLRQNMYEAGHVTFESDDATVTVSSAEAGTRSHWVGGEIDAGGPYGGGDTFEGDTLTFTVTIEDPTIIFLRYDFNADGVFDYPDQTGGGNMGKWTTQSTVTRTFYDNFFGSIVVEGWDGVSTKIQINTGEEFDKTRAIQFIIGFGTYTFANRFRAKTNMEVTALGHYHYLYTAFESRLFNSAGALLAQCSPTHTLLSWNWCTL